MKLRDNEMKNQMTKIADNTAIGAIDFRVVLILSALLALFNIYRNDLHRILVREDPYELVWVRGDMTLSLSQPMPSITDDSPGRMTRIFKLAVPMNTTMGGCEFMYSVVEASYRRKKLAAYEFLEARYLTRFEYDLKNRRCESKDLFIFEDDIPKSFEIQLIDVSLSNELVTETPRMEGFRVSFGSSFDPDSIEVLKHRFNQESSLRKPQSNVRNREWSADIRPEQIEMLISPYEQLGAIIEEEFRSRISRCREENDCDSVKVSVSVMNDPELLRLLSEAEEAGLSIDNLTNVLWRNFGEGDPETSVVMGFKPTQWLRGNPHLELAGFLPMHAKFIIFGDDTVISANSNFNTSQFYSSREYAVLYRSKELAAIFSEIFSMIRTAVFYPVRVDTRKNVSILLNVIRPRAYSVLFRKPHLTIENHDGTRSTAYGILFHLLHNQEGPLVLDMSPITNSCAFYQKRLCLFDVLKRYVEKDRLELIANSYVYLPRDFTNSVMFGDNDVLWNPDTLQDDLMLEPHWSLIENLFEGSEPQIMLKIMADKALSAHHGRLAVLGDELVLTGSANYANASTINTIEVIRAPLLNQKVRRELATYDEPYFIVPRKADRWSMRSYGNCEFIYELDYYRKDPYRLKTYSKADLIHNALKRYPNLDTSTLLQVVPSRLLDRLSNGNLFRERKYEIAAIDERIDNYSSYFCLFDPKTKETYPVRAYPEADSEGLVPRAEKLAPTLSEQ